MVFRPIVPFFGYCRAKKMMRMPTAKPASKPADRISMHRETRVSARPERRGVFIMNHKRKVFRLTVVLGPPGEVSPTDNVVKEEADENPGYIVERRRGRHVHRAREDEREIKVLEERHLELLL